MMYAVNPSKPQDFNGFIFLIKIDTSYSPISRNSNTGGHGGNKGSGDDTGLIDAASSWTTLAKKVLISQALSRSAVFPIILAIKELFLFIGPELFDYLPFTFSVITPFLDSLLKVVLFEVKYTKIMPGLIRK